MTDEQSDAYDAKEKDLKKQISDQLYKVYDAQIALIHEQNKLRDLETKLRCIHLNDETTS